MEAQGSSPDLGRITISGAVGLAVSAISAALAGEVPWWGALLAVAASAVVVGARAAMAKLPAAIASALTSTLAGALTGEDLAVRAATLPPEERARVRAALDAADAAPAL